MFATGCAGAMIARAGIGQPWLTKKLIAEMNGEKFVMPSSTEINAIFAEHLALLVQLFGNEKHAALHARKLMKYYKRNSKF